VHLGQNVALVVRHDRVERVAGTDLLSADHAGDVELLISELGEARFELGALLRT